jgi:serine/threonine protein kinase
MRIAKASRDSFSASAVDGKPVPRVIDFGLVKASSPLVAGDSPLTQCGHFMGTPGYISPEQADPSVEDIDTRSDVYSLGVVLYVLLAGSQPIDHEAVDAAAAGRVAAPTARGRASASQHPGPFGSEYIGRNRRIEGN